MGNSVSIQFKKGADVSVALFSHWGGMKFVGKAREYVADLENKVAGKMFRPLDWLEPQTVMVDFIRTITRDLDVVDSDLYLGIDGNDGDNSDNGNHIIKLGGE